MKGWVVRVHDHLGQERGDRPPVAQCVLQLLFDHVADHAASLGPEYIQWIGFVGLVGRTLKRQ